MSSVNRNTQAQSQSPDRRDTTIEQLEPGQDGCIPPLQVHSHHPGSQSFSNAHDVRLDNCQFNDIGGHYINDNRNNIQSQVNTTHSVSVNNAHATGGRGGTSNSATLPSTGCHMHTRVMSSGDTRNFSPRVRQARVGNPGGHQQAEEEQKKASVAGVPITHNYGKIVSPVFNGPVHAEGGSFNFTL
ncbi:hypothetical protein AMATHDRAFT_68201 [Amanita thiersii Skay4041]|uniref:Uncharacterized protein n=1 Tax=Amanita thiersii Skay4041 TaxID=703135 RepID=A0A2A9NHL4_9AGAR|nr:hypothetical protein AMATHDRAFT_68201 [Amanita thiersii Skay4041]